MVNSIKSNLSEEDTISEIKLLLGQPNIVCVLVEGEDDVKLFSPILSKNVCILESYGSIGGIDVLINTFFSKKKRVIAIRDRDYCEGPMNDQIFFCDYSCAEMMIVSIESCFERIYVNYALDGEIGINELKRECFERIKVLSIFRKLNYENEWKIRFDGIKPGKYCEKSISETEKDIIDDLNTLNPDNRLDEEKMKHYYSRKEKDYSIEEYYCLANGHDFINMLFHLCSRCHNKYGIDQMERSLRETFGLEEFKQTLLYKDLLNYQTMNDLCIVS